MQLSFHLQTISHHLEDGLRITLRFIVNLYTVRADILGYFPDILGQRQFQATWHYIFQMACGIRKCFKH